jgi:UDP-2,3-diacylglucosamine hydrolase
MAVAPILFLSDLHLTQERPVPVELFRNFVGGPARGAAAIYILGDFFEAWVGDDDLTLPFHAAITAELAALSRSGVRLYFLPGNRDFLIGADFADKAGLTLLNDPHRVDLFGVPTLISHGDIFCTDDVAYQTFREQVRQPAWRQQFLAQPLASRREQARVLRERSEQAKAGKKPRIMDVNTDSVADAFRIHHADRLIHGHTHRPAKHQHVVDGRPRERWVLPDWYEQGGYLACDQHGCRPVEVTLPGEPNSAG